MKKRFFFPFVDNFSYVLAHISILYTPTDQVMELDDRVNTAALMLSGDRLEASNNNWTFESVRATFCVGRSMYYTSSHPSGWYYEVTVKSTGIMQIGETHFPPYPSGWYYEVTVKSTGIMQIGETHFPPYPSGRYYEVTVKSTGIMQIGETHFPPYPCGWYYAMIVRSMVRTYCFLD